MWWLTSRLPFTYSNTSERITGHLHSLCLRTWKSHLLWLHAAYHWKWTVLLCVLPEWWIPLWSVPQHPLYEAGMYSSPRTGILIFNFAFLCPSMRSVVHLMLSSLSSTGTIWNSPQIESGLRWGPHLLPVSRRCKELHLHIAVCLNRKIACEWFWSTHNNSSFQHSWTVFILQSFIAGGFTDVAT